MNAVADVNTAPRPAPIKATWICLGIAWVLFLLPIPGAGIFVGWPLNVVAFILAIVVMARGRTMPGLAPLICSLVVSPIVYLIGLAVLAGTVASGDAYNDYVERAEAAAAQVEASEAAPAPEVITISARDLYLAYDANEVAADGQYKGKVLQVTGTVLAISKNAFDQVYVEIDTGEMFSSIHAQDLPPDVASGLSKGQEITVQCTGEGLMIGSPILSDCTMK